MKKETKQMIPLNNELFDEFYVKELEQRLETDPIAFGGLLDLTTDSSVGAEADCFTCTLCSPICEPIF